MSNKILTVYWYPRCSTCRNAVAWLQKHNVAVTLIDMVQTPPSTALLQKLFKRSGSPITRFFNTSGELYREFQLAKKLPSMTDDQALDLLSRHGKLIKRPLVFSTDLVTIGFKEDIFKRTWV